MIWGLNRWKNQVLLRETQLRNRLNRDIYMDVEKQSALAMEEESDLRAKEELHRTAKRIIIEKTMRKFMYRKQSVCIGRWKDICNLKAGQE